MVLDETVKRLRALLEKATPGPWAHGGSTSEPGERWVWEGTHHYNGDPDAPDTRICCAGEDDAALIAEARNALPALLDAADLLCRLRELPSAKPERAERADVATLERVRERLRGLYDETSPYNATASRMLFVIDDMLTEARARPAAPLSCIIHGDVWCTCPRGDGGAKPAAAVTAAPSATEVEYAELLLELDGWRTDASDPAARDVSDRAAAALRKVLGERDELEQRAKTWSDAHDTAEERLRSANRTWLSRYEALEADLARERSFREGVARHYADEQRRVNELCADLAREREAHGRVRLALAAIGKTNLDERERLLVELKEAIGWTDGQAEPAADGWRDVLESIRETFDEGDWARAELAREREAREELEAKVFDMEEWMAAAEPRIESLEVAEETVFELEGIASPAVMPLAGRIETLVGNAVARGEQAEKERDAAHVEVERLKAELASDREALEAATDEALRWCADAGRIQQQYGQAQAERDRLRAQLEPVKLDAEALGRVLYMAEGGDPYSWEHGGPEWRERYAEKAVTVAQAFARAMLTDGTLGALAAHIYGISPMSGELATAMRAALTHAGANVEAEPVAEGRACPWDDRRDNIRAAIRMVHQANEPHSSAIHGVTIALEQLALAVDEVRRLGGGGR